jgi:hypothetical protein
VQFPQFIHLPQIIENAMSFSFIQRADGKAYVNNHIVSNARLRRVGETDLLNDPAEADSPGAKEWILTGDA